MSPRNGNKNQPGYFQEHRIFVLNSSIIVRYNVDLALEIGDRESMMLLQLEYWLVSFKQDKLQASASWFQENAFKAWSIATIQRVLESLKKQELIHVEVPPGKSKFNHDGLIYSLNFEQLKKLKSLAVHTNYESAPDTGGDGGHTDDPPQAPTLPAVPTPPSVPNNQPIQNEQDNVPTQFDQDRTQNGQDRTHPEQEPVQDGSDPDQNEQVETLAYKGYAREEYERKEKSYKEPMKRSAEHRTDGSHEANAVISSSSISQSSFPDLCPEDAAIAESIVALRLESLSPSQAIKLLKQHPNNIARQVQYWPFRLQENPKLRTGAFYASLREDWPVPDNYRKLASATGSPSFALHVPYWAEPTSAQAPRPAQSSNVLPFTPETSDLDPPRPDPPPSLMALATVAPPLQEEPEPKPTKSQIDGLLPSAIAARYPSLCDKFLDQFKLENEQEYKLLEADARTLISGKAAKALSQNPEDPAALGEVRLHMRIIAAFDYYRCIEALLDETGGDAAGEQEDCEEAA